MSSAKEEKAWKKVRLGRWPEAEALLTIRGKRPAVGQVRLVRGLGLGFFFLSFFLSFQEGIYMYEYLCVCVCPAAQALGSRMID